MYEGLKELDMCVITYRVTNRDEASFIASGRQAKAIMDNYRTSKELLVLRNMQPGIVHRLEYVAGVREDYPQHEAIAYSESERGPYGVQIYTNRKALEHDMEWYAKTGILSKTTTVYHKLDYVMMYKMEDLGVCEVDGLSVGVHHRHDRG